MPAKVLQSQQRANRVRARLYGTAQRPRLTVNISARHVSAQLVDDTAGRTLAASTSAGQKLPSSLTQRAKWVGSDIAAKAKTAKIARVIFDRGSHRYHGRVKALAEAARTGGLEF